MAVVVRLKGGLGNQMFQYAAGRRLAGVVGSDLKLDLSYLERSRVRSYELKHFNVIEQFDSAGDLHASVGRSRLRHRLFGLLRPANGSRLMHVKEDQIRFDPRILELRGGVYLDGYWQSEKYFVDIEKTIRNEFTLKSPISRRSAELLEKIDSTASVSLHVRRGDYVTEPVANAVLGPCSLDYYERCAQAIGKKIADPHFFVFSDEPEWAHQNLKLGFPVTIVDHNGGESGYEDLWLMSHCRHHIVANSSFSWWGAWLGRNPERLVYAPVKWFRDPGWDDTDLVPPSWIRI